MTKKIGTFFASSGDYVKDLNSNIVSVLKKPKKSIFNKNKFDIDIFEKVLDKFHSRRSCRKFSSKPVDFKIIYDIIEASLMAPCSGGIQNIHIIAIENSHHIHDLAKIHGEQTWASTAPLMLAVVRDISEFEKLYPHDKENLSLQNSTYVASSITNLLSLTNYGSCLIRAGSNDETCKLLHIKPHMSVDCLIAIGISEYNPSVRDKLPTGQRFHFETFGNSDRGGGHH